MADATVPLAVAQTDWVPIIIAIGAAGTAIISALVTAIIQLRVGKVVDGVAKAVDGKMTEVVEIVRREAKAAGKEEARTEAVAKQGIEDAAVLKELSKAPVVTPAAVAEELLVKPIPKEK